MKRLILLILLAGALALGTFIFLMPAGRSIVSPANTRFSCTMTILHSPPITFSVPGGTTALEATQRHAKAVSKGNGADAFVIEINGRKANDAKHEFWNLKINGKAATVGAGSYIIRDNDRIEWSIATY